MSSVRYRILWGVVRESNNPKKSVLYRRDAMPMTERSKTTTWAVFHAHARRYASRKSLQAWRR